MQYLKSRRILCYGLWKDDFYHRKKYHSLKDTAVYLHSQSEHFIAMFQLNWNGKYKYFVDFLQQGTSRRIKLFSCTQTFEKDRPNEFEEFSNWMTIFYNLR